MTDRASSRTQNDQDMNVRKIVSGKGQHLSCHEEQIVANDATSDPRDRLPVRVDILIGQLAGLAVILGAIFLALAIFGGA